jgi:hypothetical protein
VKHIWRIGVAVLIAVTNAAVCAQTGPLAVTIEAPGPHTSVAESDAPRHIVGLPRTVHEITLDTGTVRYGLRYLISHDPEEPV